MSDVDLKALDFELSHDLETMSDVCTRDLSVRQVSSCLPWNSPAGRLVSARVTGHADAEANCPR
ncbi:hypothetical protein T484DRAFT_1773740 [Baffinella frigidus]|nr:hypothetical protein T484DRAFT_1773740 [Cryptophyta sp. CCMP2293]